MLVRVALISLSVQAFSFPGELVRESGHYCAGHWKPAALFCLLGHFFKACLVKPRHFAANIQVHGRHLEARPNLFERADRTHS